MLTTHLPEYTQHYIIKKVFLLQIYQIDIFRNNNNKQQVNCIHSTLHLLSFLV